MKVSWQVCESGGGWNGGDGGGGEPDGSGVGGSDGVGGSGWSRGAISVSSGYTKHAPHVHSSKSFN